MDLVSDQAYESLSEHSSRITSSNRLSTSSLSGSSLTTHSSSTNNNYNKFNNSANNRNCSNCNKKIRKRKPFRQNAVEIDSGIGRSNRTSKSSTNSRNCQSVHVSDELNSSPSSVQLPPVGGSQITLTPDLTMTDGTTQFAPLKFTSNNNTANLCRRCKSISASIQQNMTAYSSSHSNSVSSSNNVCHKESANTNSNNGNSKSKDTSILNMIKSTFTKLFEIKPTTKTSSVNNKQSKGQQQQHQQYHQSTEYNNSRFSSNRTSNCSRSSSRKRSSGSGGQSISYSSISGHMLETADDLSIFTSGIITSTPTSTPPIPQQHPANTVSFQHSPPPFSSLPLHNNSSSDSSLVAVNITNASITPQIPCFNKCRHREFQDNEYEDDEDEELDDDDDDDDCDDYEDDDDDAEDDDEGDDDVLQDYTHQYPYFYSHHSHQRHRYSLTVPTLLDYERLNRRNPRLYGAIMGGRVIVPDVNVPPAAAVPNSLVIARKPILHHQSAHIKSKSLSSHYGRGVSSVNTGFTKTNRLLCASWPPAGLHLCLHDDDQNNYKESSLFDIDEYDFTDNDFECLMGRTDKTVRNIYEFNIPYSDIKLRELVKSGPRKKIYRGHWHGEVMVFIFENLDKERDLSKFWEKVSSLTMIRHENIVLFMGASVEPHFLMVTSACNGPSLYEKIHMSREKMRQSFKVNLLRQIAQAVGYLHARSKPVIVSSLNSRNIYMEPKVVLCLLDYSHLEQDDIDTLDLISIPQHLVWYTAPELLQSVDHRKQDFPFSIPSSSFVQSTDVYSFGTLLYEIHMGRYPRSKSEAKEFVDDVCNGRRPDIKEMRASETVKNIIQECWSHDPLGRPEFSDISRELMKRNATRKRHSSSVPDHLNRDLLSYHF